MSLLTNNGLPLFVKSRRGVIVAAVLSLVLLVALWDAFGVGAPGRLRAKVPPVAAAKKRPRPGVTPGPGAPLKTSETPAAVLGNASSEDPLCARHPDMSNIGVVMKTGASEAFARMPTQYLTTLRCVDQYLVVSDMEQNIGGFHIHDALDTVLDEAKKDNSDFDIYRDQQACVADLDACTAGHNRGQAGWNLDKYKNTHMAEKAWRVLPDKDWYLFIDADTYVLWNSLVAWLARLDPTKEQYFGSVAYLGDLPFSHGGSGYILSKAAMERLVGKPGLGNKYDMEAQKVCCGDAFFSKVAKEQLNLDVSNAWPTINGETPFSLPYGPEQWCHPIVTMHHISNEQISAFWEWETDYYAAQPPDAKPSPVLIKEIYDAFFAPRLVSHRESWDNFADEVFFLDPNAKEDAFVQQTRENALEEEEKRGLEKEAHRSFAHCRRACEENKKCFQYRYKEGACGFGFSMRLGRPVPKEDTVAGWNLGKIRRWTGKRQECREVLWPEV